MRIRWLYLDESGEQDGFGLGGLVEAKAGYGLLLRLIHFASLP